MQSMSRALGYLDSIRIALLAQPISFQAPEPSCPAAHACTFTHGRGRRDRGHVHGLNPDAPHRISNSSFDSDASSHDIY